MFALAGWTALVLTLIPVARFRAAARRQVAVDDFRFGESAAVPPAVSIPNRNYMNLLEVPMLFYVACLVIYVAAAASSWAVGLAWTYVGLRVVHSLIHLSYNNVLHRGGAFAASNVVLLALWVLAALSLRIANGA
jgi:hypothetical protein